MSANLRLFVSIRVIRGWFLFLEVYNRLERSHSSFDRQRIRRRGDAAQFVERGRGEKELVDLIFGAIGGERVEIKHLSDRHPPEADDRLVHQPLVRISRRISLERGAVRDNGGEVVVPEKTQRLIPLRHPTRF